MTFGVKPYSTMKSSDVEWLGEVPGHWEVRRLRNIAKVLFSNVDKHSKDGEYAIHLCNYSDVYYNDRIQSNMDFMKATATSEEIERFRLAAGDVLITKDSESWDDIGIPALVESAGHDLICGYHLALLRPIVGRIAGEFLHAALSCRGVANQFFVYANGVTRFGLSQTAIKAVRLLIPPLPEQIAIVRFLDHIGQCIDRYIRVKEQLIVLLEKQKQVTIQEAVSGRFDVRTGQPYSAYKDSGVEWIGEVPEHWEVRPNRAIFTEVKEQNHSDEQMLSITISAGVIRQDKLIENTSKKDRSQIDKARYKLVQVGDVAYNKMRAWQGAIGTSGCRGIVSPAYIVQRPSNTINPHYIHHLFRTPNFAGEAERNSYGITSDMWSLRPEDFKTIYVSVPPLSEQTAIACYLNEISSKIDIAIAQTQREIKLFYEYRERLISDVVIGKLDVCEVAAKLPFWAGQNADESAEFI